MLQGRTALIVSAATGVDNSLRKALNEAGMPVYLARSCAEARRILTIFSPPAVVFCGESLPDGTWNDILTSADPEASEVPFIVISNMVDINLYIDALEEGAADFIVPSIYRQGISHVLSCAMGENLAIQTPASA